MTFELRTVPFSVLVRRVDGNTQLVLLDHGLYQTLKPEHMTDLSHMWKAIVLRDHKNMKFYAKQFGVDGIFLQRCNKLLMFVF
mgnify:FL=1